MIYFLAVLHVLTLFLLVWAVSDQRKGRITQDAYMNALRDETGADLPPIQTVTPIVDEIKEKAGIEPKIEHYVPANDPDYFMSGKKDAFFD